MTKTPFFLLVLVTFVGGFLGGTFSEIFWKTNAAAAGKPNGVNAEEFLLLDPSGKARAGLGLDANREVGFVLTSGDGSRTLSLSPDDRVAIKLVERGGRVLWSAP